MKNEKLVTFILYVISMTISVICITVNNMDGAIISLLYALIFRTFAVELKIKDK